MCVGRKKSRPLIEQGDHMICPRCLTEDEVVYSAVSNGLVCSVSGCGWEQELDSSEAYELIETIEQTQLSA